MPVHLKSREAWPERCEAVAGWAIRTRYSSCELVARPDRATGDRERLGPYGVAVWTGSGRQAQAGRVGDRGGHGTRLPLNFGDFPVCFPTKTVGSRVFPFVDHDEL